MSSAAQKKQNLAHWFRTADFREVSASLLLRYGWTKRCEKLLAVFWFCAAISISMALCAHFPDYCAQDYDRMGSYLFYGVQGAASFHMPLAGIVNTVKDFCTVSTQILINTGLYLIFMPLIYALAAMLHSHKAGALAVLLACLLFVCFDIYGDLEQRLLSITLLGFAFYSASDELSPALSKKIAAGVMLGCSFLVRSTMAFFPFLWCGYKLLREEKGHRRECFKKILPVLAIPFLMLVPWIIYMRLVHGTYTLFENGRANSNIITGALGLVGTIEGDTNKLAQLHGLQHGNSILLWAIKQVCLHPVRYAGAVLTRVGDVFWLHPLLFTCGTAGFIICRKNPAARTLALLAFYLAGIHCLMTIEPRYFLPLWILCIPIVAAVILHRLKHTPLVLRSLADMPCALVALGAVFVMVLLAAYPVRAARDNGSRVAHAQTGRNYWLLKCAIIKNTGEGNLETARTLAAKAVTLNPAAMDTPREMLGIYKLLLAARRDPLVARALRESDFRLAKVLDSSARGNYEECRQDYMDYRQSNSVIFRHFNSHEADIYRELDNSTGPDFSQTPDIAKTYKTMAVLMQKRLEPCIAVPSADMPIVGYDFETSTLHTAAINLQVKGSYRLSALLFNILVVLYPHDAEIRSDFGVGKALSGDMPGAEKEFRRALELDPSFAPAKISLALILSRQQRK